jgi:hypothetical protein
MCSVVWLGHRQPLAEFASLSAAIGLGLVLSLSGVEVANYLSNSRLEISEPDEEYIPMFFARGFLITAAWFAFALGLLMILGVDLCAVLVMLGV